MINQVCIEGRLVQEPELTDLSKNDTPLYKVQTSIAVSDDYNKDKTHFFSFTAWNSQATFLNNYAHKGDLISIVGRLSQRTWQDPNGNNRESVEIIVDKSYVVAKKRDEENKPKDVKDNGTIKPDELKIDFDDDELPF